MTKIKYNERFASHVSDVKTYDTQQLRALFLVDEIFKDDEINLTYTHYDRFISGGAVPTETALVLDVIDPLKASHFCERRELGIINIGEKGSIFVDGEEYVLDTKEAIYIGKGVLDIKMVSHDAKRPSKFYLNSAPAHHQFPTKKISIKDAIVLELGNPKEANERRIIQFIVAAIVETCQLQMGITELKSGSVWNTMPPHTHNRRMEVYLYIDLPEEHAICHFMGEAQETRHIWMTNNQAVISPPWSVHAASGTSNYSFVWGMAGENLDFQDMDVIARTDLR